MLFLSSEHRERQYYVYIRELVTFMERTVTIVTGRSAIAGIHTHTRVKKKKSTDNRHIMSTTEIQLHWAFEKRVIITIWGGGGRIPRSVCRWFIDHRHRQFLRPDV